MDRASKLQRFLSNVELTHYISQTFRECVRMMYRIVHHSVRRSCVAREWIMREVIGTSSERVMRVYENYSLSRKVGIGATIVRKTTLYESIGYCKCEWFGPVGGVWLSGQYNVRYTHSHLAVDPSRPVIRARSTIFVWSRDTAILCYSQIRVAQNYIEKPDKSSYTHSSHLPQIGTPQQRNIRGET